MGKSNLNSFLRVALTVGCSLLMAVIIIIFVSKDPGQSIYLFLISPLTTTRYFGNIVEMWVPLVFTGLAISIMFQAKQFNIGAEGAFYGGGVAAACVALLITLPSGLHTVAALLIATLSGGVICLIPGIIKTKYKASELVSSLMMNYLVFYLGLFVLQYVLRDPTTGSPASYKLPDSILLPKIFTGTRIHLGLFIAIAMIFILHLFLYRSKKGYELRVVGENQNFADYVGMRVGSVVLLSQFIGGAIAGLGGAVELLGMYNRFNWTRQTGFGWDGIIVAILAKNNPSLVPLSAFFLAYIRIGADIMSRNTNVTNELISIIQGFIILLIASGKISETWKRRRLRKAINQAEIGTKQESV